MVIDCWYYILAEWIQECLRKVTLSYCADTSNLYLRPLSSLLLARKVNSALSNQKSKLVIFTHGKLSQQNFCLRTIRYPTSHLGQLFSPIQAKDPQPHIPLCKALPPKYQQSLPLRPRHSKLCFPRLSIVEGWLRPSKILGSILYLCQIHF